jgi:DNA-binding response OmpR family regulator
VWSDTCAEKELVAAAAYFCLPRGAPEAVISRLFQLKTPIVRVAGVMLSRMHLALTTDRPQPWHGALWAVAGAGETNVRVLIAEDDAATRELLERGLREELFRVDTAADATSAEVRAIEGVYDAIVLDVQLPDHDGFAVCRRLRTRGIDTPILLLTGRGGVKDRVRGLDAGADDYLAKPFAFEELIARLRAVTRRGRTRHLETVLSYGPVELDPRVRTVTVDGSPVLTSHTEFRLLECLMRRAEQTISRDELFQRVWDRDSNGSNVIDVYVSYLRKKLGPAGAMLRTVRRGGYVLTKGLSPQ